MKNLFLLAVILINVFSAQSQGKAGNERQPIPVTINIKGKGFVINQKKQTYYEKKIIESLRLREKRNFVIAENSDDAKIIIDLTLLSLQQLSSTSTYSASSSNLAVFDQARQQPGTGSTPIARDVTYNTIRGIATFDLILTIIDKKPYKDHLTLTTNESVSYEAGGPPMGSVNDILPYIRAAIVKSSFEVEKYYDTLRSSN